MGPSKGMNRLQVKVLFLLGMAMMWKSSWDQRWKELGLKAKS